MVPMQPRPVLRRFFAGVTEHAFQTRLGIADPPLVDYLSEMLVRFVRSDSLYRFRDQAGRPLTEVVEMLIEGDMRIGEARREVHQHIGDFILFWAGVFPEALRRLKGPHSKDRFVNYCEQGKRSYYIASTIEANIVVYEKAPSDVLERLSDQFEVCMVGLSEVRREWERRDEDPDGPSPLWIH